MNKITLVTFLVFCAAIIFTSCEKDDNMDAKLFGKWERHNTELSGIYGIIITKDTYQRIDEDGEGSVCSAKTTKSHIEVYCENSISEYLWIVQNDTLFLGLGQVYKRVDKFSWE